MSLTKSQKQLILLGVLLAAIVAVLGLTVFRPETFESAPYQPKAVDAVIPREVIDHPEYRSLKLPVELPLTPGVMGRDNPFEPY